MSDPKLVELYASAHLKIFAVLKDPIFEVNSTDRFKPLEFKIYTQALTRDFKVRYNDFEVKLDITGLHATDFSFSETGQSVSTTTTITGGEASPLPPPGQNAFEVKDVRMRRISSQTQKDAKLTFQIRGVGGYTLYPIPSPPPEGSPIPEVITVVSQTRA